MNRVLESEQERIANRAGIEKQELINIYISKSKFHKKNWSDYENGKQKLNGFPFFIGGFWFFFKGMFLFGFMYIAFITTLFLISSEYEVIFRTLFVSVNVMLIFNCNQSYYQYILKKINTVIEKEDNHERRLEILQKSKKKNTIAGIILNLLIILLIISGLSN